MKKQPRIWPLARRRAVAAMERYEEIVRGNRETKPGGWDTFAAVGWDINGECTGEAGDTFQDLYHRPPTDAEVAAMDPLFDALQEKLKREWRIGWGFYDDETDDVEPCSDCQQPRVYLDDRWWHLLPTGGSCHLERMQESNSERPEQLGRMALVAAIRATGEHERAKYLGVGTMSPPCVEHSTAGRRMVTDAELAPLEAEFDEAFAALKAAGIEHDADDPIAERYRRASDAVNHAHRSRDFAIATGQPTDGTDDDGWSEEVAAREGLFDLASDPHDPTPSDGDTVCRFCGLAILRDETMDDEIARDMDWAVTVPIWTLPDGTWACTRAPGVHEPSVRRVQIKQTYASWYETAIEVDVPTDVDDLDDWARQNFDRLFTEARDNETLAQAGKERATTATVLWEAEAGEPVNGCDDEYTVIPDAR